MHARSRLVTLTCWRCGAESFARLEGLGAAPESGAAVAGLRRLVANGRILSSERVVLINTGAGDKHPNRESARIHRTLTPGPFIS